jgi:hypothetical protein
MEMPWLDGGLYQFFPAGGRRFMICSPKNDLLPDGDFPVESAAG